jgi:hypothetical protein
MNKRIWELADQCQEYKPGFDGQEDWYTVFNKQKFAELIIRECVDVVKWTPSLYPNDEYVKNIKQHFGVKE